MTATVFAGYDPDGELTPRFFPLGQTADTSDTITDRAYDLGVRMKKGRMMREIVSMSGDTVLIHFGTIIRFPKSDKPKVKTIARYAVGATEAEKDALVRVAEIAALDPGFMAGMWEHLKATRHPRDGDLLPEQDHLHIALVTDLLNPGRYAATTVDQGATA
ncbi:MAG: hypothetical protein ACTH2U_08395 [Brevibacterium sp.]